jgi:hypothetical protein
MKLALLMGVGLVALVVALLRKRSGDGPRAVVADIPDGVRHLRQRGRDRSFLVFMFVPRDRRDRAPVNLQYSVERGRLGLDWVLLSPANVDDRARVEAFARARGHAPAEQTVNGVRFLRIEDGDVTQLGVQIVRELYGLAPDAELETVVDGFEWAPARSRAS